MDPRPGPHPHAAAHHGAAALALAAVFLLMTLPTFQMAFWLEAGGYRGWSAGDKRLAAYGGYAGAGLVVLLSLAGVVVGLRGNALADRTGEPRVLCVVGVVLCLFAAAVWVLVGVAWDSQARGFI
ncbi:MAG: hypothetical protein C0501_06820 [Isosphaera sp.]|nr:hypothetical protein [Isosphaera sp.]